jgi:hypothetical protein
MLSESRLGSAAASDDATPNASSTHTGPTGPRPRRRDHRLRPAMSSGIPVQIPPSARRLIDLRPRHGIWVLDELDSRLRRPARRRDGGKFSPFVSESPFPAIWSATSKAGEGRSFRLPNRITARSFGPIPDLSVRWSSDPYPAAVVDSGGAKGRLSGSWEKHGRPPDRQEPSWAVAPGHARLHKVGT